jgi:hypothetical protein
MTRNFGKIGQSWFVRAVTLVFAFGSLVGGAVSESVVVLQGYQSQAEKYAANTVDAYIKAFNVSPGVTVTALRPKSQPGWEGGETYDDKASLLDRLKGLAGVGELVLVLVGDADGPDGSLAVGADTGVSASELTDAISSASRISLVSAGCNALATDVAGNLRNTSVVFSAIGADQAAHHWPKGNRGQYDLFSRYLLEGFYLLATNVGVSGSTSDLIGKAYGSAARKMIRASGGRQSPISASNYGDPGEQAKGPVISVGNREYVFSLQDLGNGSLSGYVGNALGLPIAPIQSGRIEAGHASFSFTERGRERTVTIADASGVPAVTLDGKPDRFSYRPTRIDLLFSRRHIGVTYLTPTVGADPRVMTILENGQSAADVAYDVSSHTLSMQLPQGGTSLDASITFGPLGEVQVQIGESAYKANQVLRYGFYDDEGERVASAVAVLSEGKLSGEILPAMSEMRLPLEATLVSGEVTGSASLVGNTTTLSSGWTWESNRPPSSGTIQPNFFDLPMIGSAYVEVSSDDGSVSVTWEVDNGTISDALLMGDLSFQVVRTDRFDNKAETFDIPAGRRQYTDRPSGDPKAFDYAVRPILDHRVTTCVSRQSYSVLGEAVAAVAGVARPKAAQTAPVVASAPAQTVAGGATETVVAEVEPKEMAEAAGEDASEKEEEKDEEDETSFTPWKKKKKGEGEGVGGKIVYGLLGLLMVIGLAIAVGGSGTPGEEPL